MAGGTFDLFTKDIFRDAGKDVVAWLTGLTPIEVEPVRAELVVAEARQMDALFRFVLPGDVGLNRFLHVEIQTAGDPDMPRRMREYWMRAERTLVEEKKGGGSTSIVRLSSFVVYLDRKQYRPDPGEIRYQDDLGTECIHRYRVIKIWEKDPGTVYRLPFPYLVPLAPLMRTPDPVATMIESRNIIRAWNPDLVPPSKSLSQNPFRKDRGRARTSRARSADDAIQRRVSWRRRDAERRSRSRPNPGGVLG